MRRFDLGGILFGLVIVAVGGYFVLKNTLGFEIPDLNWDAIWPFLIVVLGISIVWNGWQRSTTNRP